MGHYSRLHRRRRSRTVSAAASGPCHLAALSLLCGHSCPRSRGLSNRSKTPQWVGEAMHAFVDFLQTSLSRHHTESKTPIGVHPEPNYQPSTVNPPKHAYCTSSSNNHYDNHAVSYTFSATTTCKIGKMLPRFIIYMIMLVDRCRFIPRTHPCIYIHNGTTPVPGQRSHSHMCTSCKLAIQADSTSSSPPSLPSLSGW